MTRLPRRNFSRVGCVQPVPLRLVTRLESDGFEPSGLGNISNSLNLSNTRMALTQDIEARVRHDFPANEVGVVTQMLAELQREDAQLCCDRILRCLVFVASGRFAAFVDAVALARTDYRDLIVSAEYDNDWRQIRDFNQPFGHVS